MAKADKRTGSPPEWHVHSEYAPPSRPGGYFGIRQPIMPDPPAVPPPDGVPDHELADAAAAMLAQDGRVDETAIGIESRDGVIDLTGEVALEFQRTLAEALVEAVPGVLIVRNRLAVREVRE